MDEPSAIRKLEILLEEEKYVCIIGEMDGARKTWMGYDCASSIDHYPPDSEAGSLESLIEAMWDEYGRRHTCPYCECFPCVNLAGCEPHWTG